MKHVMRSKNSLLLLQNENNKSKIECRKPIDGMNDDEHITFCSARQLLQIIIYVRKSYLAHVWYGLCIFSSIASEKKLFWICWTIDIYYGR